MAYCPSCGAEIEELNLIWVEKSSFIAFISNGELGYRNKDTDEDEELDEDEETYSCPCCDAIVAYDIDEAKQLLLRL